MKKTILLLVALLIGSQTEAVCENWFREGTQWTVSVNPGLPESPDLNSFTVVYWLESDGYIGSNPACVLRSATDAPTADGRYIARIYCDGDKVYSAAQGEPDQWALAYDFSLAPGEGTTIALMGQPSTTDYALCTAVTTETVGGQEWQVIELDEYETEGGLQYMTGFNWYVGLGSQQGPDRNGFFSMIGDGTSTLIKVTNGGQTIFERSDVGALEQVETAEAAAAVRIFDLSGRETPNADAPGLYLRLEGTRATKILVR